MTDKEFLLENIAFVEAILKKLRAALEGKAKLTDREINDLTEILGFYPEEITGLLETA